MKNLKLVVLFALVFNLVAVSCKSDDDTSGSDNVMTIDGEEFLIERGFLIEFEGGSNGVFDWDVELFSSGFTIDIDGEVASGTGGNLYLDLNTNSEAGLVPGVYVFSDTREAFTWFDAEGSSNFNIATGDGNFFEAVSGTVTVSGTGNDQLIEANLVDTNGNALTASYRGSLEVFQD
jgi:hypothetical protein